MKENKNNTISGAIFFFNNTTFLVTTIYNIKFNTIKYIGKNNMKQIVSSLVSFK